MLTSIKKSRKLLTSLVGLISAMILFQCIKYSSYPLPTDQPVVFDGSKKVILYSGYNRYNLVNIQVQGNQFTCHRTVSHDNPKQPMGVEMHLYLNESYVLSPDSLGRITIPFETITHVEIQDMDLAKTVLYSMGGMIGCVGIFFVGLLLTSCPFVYDFDGEQYQFAGEIYAGSVYPPLERHDYLVMPHLKESDGTYKLKITNEVREIQHTNLLDLIAVDHPHNSSVRFDKYGDIRTILEPESPVSAVSNGEYDILSLIEERDDELFISEAPLGSDALMDSIVLRFQKPANTSNAKLIMQGRNSLWLDHVYGVLAEKIGKKYETWQSKQADKSRDELIETTLAQGIPMSVYLDEGNGWEMVDYFNIAGPLATKEDVLNLDLSQVEGDFVNIKLTFGHLFWEIDKLAMDFTPDIPVHQTSLTLTQAISQDGTDIHGLVNQDDGEYYVQSEIGDSAELVYESIPKPNELKRTFLLHSKGHYKVIRENTSEPDLVQLSKYQKPGGLLEFSRDHMNDLMESIASRK